MFQAHVRSYLQTTVHMYQQLLQVQNRVMDDFDSFLENQIHVSTGGEISQQQQQQQQQQKELEKKKKHFLDCMAEISTELSLLGQQRESLEQQDTGPSKEDPLTSQILSSQNPPLSSQNRPLSSTESQEKMTEDESLEDFFSLALYPNETLLNRYAAMIYTTTDNGRIYEEIAGASMCNSCGEKTFLCPHKVGGTQVTDLPKHCTHIKICRPHAHRFTMAAKLAGSRMSDHAEKTGAGMALSRAVSPGPYIPARAGTALAQQALGDNPSQSVPSLSSWQGSWAPVDLSRLEKHFEKQFKHKREAPRMMSLDLCLSLTEQLMTNLLCHRKSKSTQVLSIQGTLWDLLTQRYVADNISALGLQDFLAAVWKYSAVSKVVSVLGQVLRGDMDPAILHYVLLQAELLNLLPLTAPSHLHLVIEQNYPFLEETEQDSLVLEFTAYSERCVSSACVMAFILHLILQHNEPFILECEDKLLPYLKTQTDFLTYEELSVALDELAPGNCTEEKHSLIQQSLVSLSSTLIPIQHAAQIVAYLTKSGERQKRKEQLHIAIAMDKGNAESKRTKGPESMAHVCDLRFLSNVLHLAKITRTFTD
ncbi:uncharacterized protein LOC142501730 isoform X2 [Ascaphus truei]|uniref:uncharacterized protein LOC142501730 isoform X2 n=1 Tax=Ascaphus truei TaxID=8439 RepID=UPI003F591943